MKNNEKNSNKKIAGMYYFASLCFYIAAIINFINGDNNSIAVVFLCLGSSSLCLGSVYLNKDNGNNDNKK
ncbi:MAG: hypothetical protein VZS44_09320 [Bacilli bacterium]|nr:hypothetical protein [Bacilli bacterium]